MPSSRRRIQLLVDRCRLLATAALVFGVPALICLGGIAGVVTFAITVVALALISRYPHALHALGMTGVGVIQCEDDNDRWDARSPSSPTEYTQSFHDPGDDDAESPGPGARDFGSALVRPRHSFPTPDPAVGAQGFGFEVNPATGFPMISGDTSGVDVAGNPFGFSSDTVGATGISPLGDWP